MRALPLPSLHKAIDEFEARVLRDSLLKSDSDMEGNNNNDEVFFSDDEDCPRQTFGRLRGIGSSQIAPVIRVPNGPPGVLKSKNKSGKNFDIFIDSVSSTEDISEERYKSIADELANDPDYQVVF